MKISKSAKRRLQQYILFLLDNDWKIYSNNMEFGHIVLRKDRLVPNTFNMIGLRVIVNDIWVAVAVNNVHSVQEKIINYKHFKKIIEKWGNG